MNDEDIVWHHLDVSIQRIVESTITHGPQFVTEPNYKAQCQGLIRFISVDGSWAAVHTTRAYRCFAAREVSS